MTKELIGKLRELSDRESLSQLIALGLDDTKNLEDWPQDYQDEMHQAADVILAAGFSRAAVPDAATELRPLPENGCDKQAHDTLNRNLNLVHKANTGLVYDLEAMKEERDAALEAIERVRAVALPATIGNHDPHNDWNVGRHGLAKQVLEAALDGAPEPEVKP